MGVDVARFKSEFLADYWARHGTSARARLLGHVHELSRVGQPLRAALELGRAERAVRWMNERLFGLDRRRCASCLAASPPIQR